MIKKCVLSLCGILGIVGTLCLRLDAAPEVRRLGYVYNSSDATAVAFSPDGKTLADGMLYLHKTGSKWDELGAIRLWNVKTGKRLRVLRPFGEVHSVAFSPNGRLLAAGLELGSGRPVRGQVNVWNTSTWRMVAKLKVPEAHVYAIAFTPNGKLVAAGCGDSSVRLWDWAKNKVSRVLRGPGCSMSSLAVSPNGQYLAAGSVYAEDKAAQLWEVSTGRSLYTWQHQGQVAFSPDSQTVATSETQQESTPYPLVRLWSVANGKLLKTLPSRHYECATFLAFSPDGRFLAVNTSEGDGQVWSLRQDKIVQTLDTSSSREITFAPNGKLLAEAGFSSAVYLHRINAP
jgi:WD40 repeat protein